MPIQGIDVYAVGLISLSVCAPKNMTIEEVTKAVNAEHPTGLKSRWVWAEGENFLEGYSNPRQCEGDADRLHYLFHC